MSTKLKSIIKLTAGLAVSAVFIIITFYNIDFTRLFQELLNVSIITVLLYTVFIFFNAFFRALMWKVTTRALGGARFRDLFGGVVTGLLVNNFLPFRAGDFYRAYYLAKKNNYSKTSVLSTVFIERIFDVLSLSFLLFAGIIYGIRELHGSASNKILIIVFIVLIIGIVALIYMKEIIEFIEKMHYLPEKLIILIKKFLAPFFQIRSMKTILLMIVYSFFIWLSLYLSVVAVLFHVGDLRFQCSFVLLIFLYLGLLIPSSPGAIGVVQIAFWLVCVNYGMSKEQAVSYSIIYQGVYYIFTIVCGLPFFIKSNISIKSDL